MDTSKAHAILKLLRTGGQVIRGLREIKKRIHMDRANVSIFR